LNLQAPRPMSRVMLSEQEDLQPSPTQHNITKCARTEVYRYLYSARLWLAQVRCPECGRAPWINLNPKGQTAVTCNGEKMQVVKDDYRQSLESSFDAGSFSLMAT
jgi:hypothetical protein